MSDEKYFITTEELRKDLDELNYLRKENARLREALKDISKRASNLIVLSQDLYDNVSSLERGE